VVLRTRHQFSLDVESRDKKAHEFCCSEQGRTLAVCKGTIFTLVLSSKIDNSELHAGSLKARKVWKTCVSDVAKLKIWQFVYKP